MVSLCLNGPLFFIPDSVPLSCFFPVLFPSATTLCLPLSLACLPDQSLVGHQALQYSSPAPWGGHLLCSKRLRLALYSESSIRATGGTDAEGSPD